jgi:hypothetical protein
MGYKNKTNSKINFKINKNDKINLGNYVDLPSTLHTHNYKDQENHHKNYDYKNFDKLSLKI